MKILKTIFIALFLSLTAVILSLAVYTIWWLPDLPMDENMLELEEISPYMINATNAVEEPNERFLLYESRLAKNIILENEKYRRSVKRHFLEYLVAMKINVKYDDNEILSFYLNSVPYGHNAVGISQASQHFFDKPAKDLTLAESSILAALPNAPTKYSPYGANRDLLLGYYGKNKETGERIYHKGRKDFVLDEMWENDMITISEMVDARMEFDSIRFKDDSALEIKYQNGLKENFFGEFTMIGPLASDTQNDQPNVLYIEKVGTLELKSDETYSFVPSSKMVATNTDHNTLYDFFSKNIAGTYSIEFEKDITKNSMLEDFESDKVLAGVNFKSQKGDQKYLRLTLNKDKKILYINHFLEPFNITKSWNNFDQIEPENIVIDCSDEIYKDKFNLLEFSYYQLTGKNPTKDKDLSSYNWLLEELQKDDPFFTYLQSKNYETEHVKKLSYTLCSELEHAPNSEIIVPELENMNKNIVDKIKQFIAYDKLNREIVEQSKQYFYEQGWGLMGNDYKINYDQNNILSVTFISYGVAAYPSTSVETFNFDLQNSEKIGIDDIVKNDKKEDLIKILDQKLQENKKKKYDSLPKDSEKGLKVCADVYNFSLKNIEFKTSSFNEIAITEEGIYFKYEFGFAHVNDNCEPVSYIFMSYKELDKFLYKKNGKYDFSKKEVDVFNLELIGKGICGETYAKDDAAVYYISLGGTYKDDWRDNEYLHINKLEGADPKHFEEITQTKEFFADPNCIGFSREGSLWGKDWFHDSVYYLEYKIEGAYSGAFKPLEKEGTEKGFEYATDGSHLYFLQNKIANVDPETFKYDQDPYFFDKNGVYFGHDFEKLDADLESFEIINSPYSKDKNNIFYQNEKIPEADVASFKEMGKYSKDKNHVYSGTEIIEAPEIQKLDFAKFEEKYEGPADRKICYKSEECIYSPGSKDCYNMQFMSEPAFVAEWSECLCQNSACTVEN